MEIPVKAKKSSNIWVLVVPRHWRTVMADVVCRLVGEGKLGSEAADELTPPPPMAATATKEAPFSNGNHFYTI